MKKIRQVYQMLEDEVSRDIYLHRLNFLVSGDMKHMDHIIEQYLPEIKRKTTKLEDDIAESCGDREVIIWGTGINALSYQHVWDKLSHIKYFCDKSLEKQGGVFCGYQVITPEEVFKKHKHAVIVISTSKYQEEVKRELLKGDVSEKNIFYLSHYIFCISYKQYFYEGFMDYQNEVFVDAGSKDLESVLDLQRVCGGRLKKAYAFEPDEGNCRCCLQKKETKGLSNIEVLPYGTWSCSTELKFDAQGNGLSSISENGKVTIHTRAIDDVVEDGVTFIKMDVEGAELESLRGAAHTIKKYRPKLAICIYHKPEDMTEIPLYIKSLVPEYKLYVRHYSNSDTETVLYAVV